MVAAASSLTPTRGRNRGISAIGGLVEDGIFVKYSVIGVYLAESSLPWLAVKWKGKTAKELVDFLKEYRQFEKFYRVTLVYPLTGSKFVEKVEANSIAIMKSAGVYGDAEMRATENFVELFQKENLPPKTGFSIIYTQSPAGSLPVRFSNDGSIPEEGNVIVNKALLEAVLDSIVGKNGVSPAAKRSLAERLSELFKAKANSVA
ncbi:hypothetical protein TIFTF001_037985 [Ficus carica]|uniref:Chalcone-flavonone isomerase family protein n=1 Tax=Ficus carica TaxID=3494 RepID=A0AA88E767_FICCA|nr:hypothetical protein TIFTF001_037981 [Ficus carica]GMN68933.1 hypothetical protein TIFTF001_037985 [Ficus carica]